MVINAVIPSTPTHKFHQSTNGINSCEGNKAAVHFHLWARVRNFRLLQGLLKFAVQLFEPGFGLG
jgi:hypothetical protein